MDMRPRRSVDEGQRDLFSWHRIEMWKIKNSAGEIPQLGMVFASGRHREFSWSLPSVV